MAVSPFDGANRIRFKGSLGFRFLIADLRFALVPRGELKATTWNHIYNHRKTKNHQTLSHFNAAPPKTLSATIVYYMTGFCSKEGW
jgi:hypothetical protein